MMIQLVKKHFFQKKGFLGACHQKSVGSCFKNVTRVTLKSARRLNFCSNPNILVSNEANSVYLIQWVKNGCFVKKGPYRGLFFQESVV